MRAPPRHLPQSGGRRGGGSARLAPESHGRPARAIRSPRMSQRCAQRGCDVGGSRREAAGDRQRREREPGAARHPRLWRHPPDGGEARRAGDDGAGLEGARPCPAFAHCRRARRGGTARRAARSTRSRCPTGARGGCSSRCDCPEPAPRFRGERPAHPFPSAAGRRRIAWRARGKRCLARGARIAARAWPRRGTLGARPRCDPACRGREPARMGAGPRS